MTKKELKTLELSKKPIKEVTWLYQRIFGDERLNEAIRKKYNKLDYIRELSCIDIREFNDYDTYNFI